MVVKTFRGLLADGGQDRIRLQTIKGKVGYRVVKFQIMPNTPGVNIDSLVKITKTDSGVAPTNAVNFSDSDLLGAAWSYNDTYETDMMIIFDNEIFNQDIFIEHHEDKASQSINYYIELEVIPLDDKGAEYTTVKDLRTRGF